jgi:signal transduction histidine kinase
VSNEPDRLPDPIRQLRHDLANPLAALLAETQLLLLNANRLDQETVDSLHEIEALARRMRDILTVFSSGS